MLGKEISERRSVGSTGEVDLKKKRSRTMVMTGLALGMLLASLDGTVIGTSLPHIVGELGGMSLFSWLFTAYLLSETVTTPIWGKLSDRMGRRPIFLAGMGLFMSGSIIGGLSTSMDMLIVSRFVQGLGGGALLPVAMVTVADLYPPADRAKVQGMLGGIFAIASIIGPFIGGFIVDNFDWRWVFFVNLPIGLASVAVAGLSFPTPIRVAQKRIDALGMATLAAALTALLLILTWGGSTYDWLSVVIVGLGLVVIVSLMAFITVEMRVAEDPIMPLRLFCERTFALGNIGLLLVSIGLFGVIAFLPMFLQAIIGMSATNSGETLIPLMLGTVITSIVSGVLMKRTGFKVWLVVGPPMTALGLFLLSTLHSGSSQVDAILYLLITGGGLGMVTSTYIVAAQNKAAVRDLGVVTSTMSLSRGLGATIGITILGTVVNREMLAELSRNLPIGVLDALPTTDVNELGRFLLIPNPGVPTGVLDVIRTSLSNSMTAMFAIGAVIVVLGTVASLLIKGAPLREMSIDQENPPTVKAEQAVDDAAGK